MNEDKSLPKVKIYFEETVIKKTLRGPVSICHLSHPELAGMNKEEMIDFIRENIHFMKAINKNFYETLDQEIENYTILEEKSYTDTIKFNFL